MIMRAPKARAKFFAKKVLNHRFWKKKYKKVREQKKSIKKSIKVSKKYNLADFQKKV